MAELGRTLTAAAGMFAGTNIDDIILLTMLFLGARSAGRPLPRQIWTGQYVGVAALVAVSVAAALGLTLVPDDRVGLLGLVPLALGVYALIGTIRARGSDEEAAPPAVSGTLAVAGLTIANGADNISVYTPVFRTIGPAATAVTIAVFAAGVALWCLAASWLGSHRRMIAFVERYGPWLVPAVFIVIGVVIVLESGVLTRLG
ncbi:cadmium transporter [Actinomadura sp. NBRC 104412]|uniref:cadmium resistance transporter n=1 Tax=Actinomadura sp. NBRC 104412 TaxID=3032203 RepID=UPI00249FED86|nr:cadmium resistance transporter [Actinomadura sp. NBRC 104412]GLZ08494.1 cadmium transporter [Actinomadura sp. NBRC 104412]